MPSVCRYGTSARASANPKSGVSWRRYVAVSSRDTPQHRHRPALDGHLGARHEPVGDARASREDELPACAEAAGRQPVWELLEVRVEEQQERVVSHLLAASRLHVQLLAVQEDA